MVTSQSASTARGGSRVFLIDDHPLMRIGIAQVLNEEAGLSVCGESDRTDGTLQGILETQPDVILLDLGLPDGNGIELIKSLIAAGVSAPILVLSMHEEDVYAERALRAGARGYLMKDQATEHVVEAVRRVLQNDVYLSEAMTRRMLSRLTGGSVSRQPVESLTDREFEVFELIGRGLPTREIAASLNISTKTVDAHRANIKFKLKLRDGADLVRYAVHWVDGANVM